MHQNESFDKIIAIGINPMISKILPSVQQNQARKTTQGNSGEIVLVSNFETCHD